MSKVIRATGFKTIPIRDVPVWVKVFEEEGIVSSEEMLKELTLIDDLLSLQKSQSQLRSHRNLQDQLAARISSELEIGKESKEII